MTLDRITLCHFRNHVATRLQGTRRFNLLVGENGAGKTNMLEAISLLAPGRGLRRAQLAEMTMGGKPDAFAISAALDCGDGGDPVTIATGTRAGQPSRRIVQVNGAETSAIRLGEWLAIGWLTPAMDRIFTEGASARRRFMDRLALALDPAHARHASRHESALRERNRLLALEAEPEPAWLDAIEMQLAEAGSALATSRSRLVETLRQEVERLPDRPFARPALAYLPGGPLAADELAAALKQARPRDRAAQRTLTGPHRDDLDVSIAGKGTPAASCSTGEQKAMLIAIILAHAGPAAQGRPSALLLDEVAAHLDPIRRAALFERLRAGRAQVWMTGTELAPFQEIKDEAAIWRVAGGEVEQIA